ncbi:MAG: tRNA (adenosine(37)-N6)-dimethylallyltransferase, partial [Propionibacteriaceae bacterium]
MYNTQPPDNDSLRHTVDVTVVLVGPTTAGKSSLGAALVRRYAAEGRRAEAVNADSMLVYRGMDIGTAKPSAAERAEIRHHMVDLLDVDQSATVAEFQQLARAAIADCRARNVIPIVVGGSALY